MRQIQKTMVAACAALALTAGAATAQTIPPDRTTKVTFSGPVSVPGMTLPAGTYTFRIMDSNSDRHIVQIFDRDGMKLMTTLLAVPASRNEPTGDPIITFKETPSDRPPAVHYWYYAGDKDGNELVYPKNQAVMIANASGEPVMSVDSTGSSIDDWKSGSMARVKPGAATTSTTTADTTSSPQQPTPASAATTTQPTTTTADQPAPSTPAPAQPAQPTTTMDQSAQPATPAPQPTAAPTTAPSTPDTVGTSGRTESLPHTASELPLVGLIGLLALGGALAFRVSRAV